MASTMLERRRFFPDFAELQERFDRVLDDLGNGTAGTWKAAIDVVREKDRIVLRVDMPGIAPEDVAINVEDDILTVSGEHEESTEKKEEDFIKRERRYGSFSRSLALPPDVDPNAITATSKHGVVEVAIPLPKKKEKKAVEIKAQAA
jgi:HSP20 family protein